MTNPNFTGIIKDMNSVKRVHDGRRRHTAHGCSSRSSRSSECNEVEYNKQPVYYIVTSDKNLRDQSDNDIDDLVVGGRRESSSKAQHNMSGCSNNNNNKSGSKQLFMSVPDRRVIDRSTFKRLKSKAVVVTAADRRKIAEDLMADRERLENESAVRKQKLQSYDVLRTKCKQLAQVSGT